jgi:organic hydroperoxide reductase OsmC/OhrA
VHPYPHTYVVAATGDPAGTVAVSSSNLPNLHTAPPPEFDGPGGMWSPESLLCASLADCFILTFRVVSRAARLEWQRLECRLEGVLDRVERTPQFTRFTIFATLTITPGTDTAKARELLERAERSCLIANSLRASRALNAQVLAADR